MAYRQTLADLRTAVRDNLDETTASFWTDAQLNRCLTRATDVAWMEIRKLKADYFLISRTSADGSVTIYGDSYATSSFAIVAGTATYTLPQDLAELKLIECITAGYEGVVFDLSLDLTAPDFRRARTYTEAMSPTRVFCDVTGERTLVIAPTSDTALDLRLWYVPRTVIFSTAGASLMAFAADTDELALPHPMYLAVEELATARAQLKDRDQTAAVWQQMAQGTVARFFGGHQRQTQDPEYVQAFDP